MSTLVLASAEYDLIGRFPIGKNPLKQKTHDSKTGATYRLHWCSKKVQVVFFCPTSLGYAEDLLQMANVLYRRDGGRCFFFSTWKPHQLSFIHRDGCNASKGIGKIWFLQMIMRTGWLALGRPNANIEPSMCWAVAFYGCVTLYPFELQTHRKPRVQDIPQKTSGSNSRKFLRDCTRDM